MDANVIAALAPSAGSESPVPLIVIQRDGTGRVVALRDEALVTTEAGEVPIGLRPLRDLFAGDAKAPDLSQGPTPKLEPFFMALEHTVVRFCATEERDATDQEMEQIFSQLRRRPDGAGGALRSYVRAAAQLYLSVRDVSAAEYEAVMTRLAKSARTFSEQPISRNYLATLRDTLGE